MRKKLLSFLKKTCLTLLGICCFFGVYAQTTIVSANFNGSAGIFTNTSNLSFVGGNSTGSQKPANFPFFSEGTEAGSCTNQQTILSTSNINTSAYCNNKLSFRLAAWSLNSSNGLEDGDNVIVEISTNGGSSYNDLLEVTGKSQAFWHYSTGTAVASVPFSSTAGVTVFTPSSGGGRTSDGYSTVEITNLPSISNLRVRITLDCDNINERWTIDDFKITGDLPATTPTVSISTPSFSICQGASATFSSNVTNGGSNSSYQWLLNGNPISGATSATYTSSSISNSNTVSLRVTSSGNCRPSATSGIITMTVLPAQNSVIASASSNQICRGFSVQLNASASTTPRFDTAFINGYESNQAAWTLVNGSTGGSTSSRNGTIFTFRQSTYSYGGDDYSSNDNSRFVFANSENHSGATNVSIISPSFSTEGFSSGNLEFFHYYNDNGSSTANVLISTNGTNWTSLQSYTNDVASRTNFSKATIAIPAGFLNQSTVFIRFNFVTTAAERYWAIDNVLVSGTKNHVPTFSWVDQNNSTIGNQANISSYSPNQSANLTLSATNIFGCSSNRTVAVQVDQPTQNGSISGDHIVCRGINSGVLQVQNKLGNVVKWQWSTSGNVWNDISSNLDSLIFSNLITQRQFRAEVKNGVCASAFTPNFPVNVKNKNWTGEFNSNWFDSRNWCGGIPDSTEDVNIPYGTLWNPVLNGNLTIQNISLNDTIFVGSNSMTIKGDLNGQGKIKTTSNSSLKIEGNGAELNLPLTDVNNQLGTLVVNRSSGVKISKSVTINNLLNLTNGNVTLDNSDLSLGRNANIQGGHSNSYLKTNGTGQVTKDFNSNETFTFPVGNSTYNAATIKNKDGGVMGVRIEDLLRTDCASGNTVSSEAVNRTWHITKNGANVFGVDLTFQWNSSDEMAQFNRSLCYASHCNSSNNTWEKLSSGSKSASGSGPYSISYTNYMGTFSPFGVGSGNGALPVTWVQVAAKKVNETTLVTWSTASEKGTDRFEIERSLDGKSFEKIGQVSAVGNSNTLQNYSFTDAQIVSSTSYYRIKSVDFDGTTEYSKTVMVQFNDSQVSTFPNPTTGKIFLQGVDKAEVEIVSTLGKVVSKFNFNGNFNSEIDLAQLPDGIYFISITQNQTTQQIRVVKSNP